MMPPPHSICTYSKSSGLLSIPTFGGAIHPAYRPALPHRHHQTIQTRRIPRRRQKLPPPRLPRRRTQHPAGSAFATAHAPIRRPTTTCGSASRYAYAAFSITWFHPTTARQTAPPTGHNPPRLPKPRKQRRVHAMLHRLVALVERNRAERHHALVRPRFRRPCLQHLDLHP